MFIKNGKKNLSCTEEESEDLFNQLISFSEYGFNKSVDKHTYIPTPKGLKKICDFQKGDKVYCIDEQGNKIETDVVNLHDHGILEGYKVIFDDGYEVICTINHKFLTKDGQISLREILAKDVSVFCEKEYGEKYASKKTIKSSLRRNISVNKNNVKTPAKLSRMSKVRLGWRKNLQISMSNGISKRSFERQASKNLRGLRKNKERKHKSKEFKDKSLGRSSESIFYCCKKNIGPPRDTSTKGRTIEKVEGREPRKICKMYRSSMEKSKKIKDGNLAAKTIKMEDEADSLRGRKKTSRFCKKKNLDRSGWILSLFRTSKSNRRERPEIVYCSTERFNVERRVLKEEGCDVNKNKYALFSKQYRENEARLVGSVSEHAPISNTGGLVPRKIVRVVPVGKCHMFDLEVANRTHNFILPNGIVTSNSHACAYTHISARLLYLKSHYPHEFYAAILMCEDNTDKIKEYRKEIIKHNVKINKIDINKSKANFSLVDDEIYFGFSNVKGIGINIAEQIVEKQPYTNFEDFVDRFGSDSSVLKPLIATGSFKDSDPVTLFKFSEAYKDYTKKKIDRKKRHQASSKKNKEVLMDLIDRAENSNETIAKLSKGEIQAIDSKDLKKVSNCEIWKERYKGLKIDDKDLWKEVCKLINKMTRATEKFKLKDNQDKPKLESFDPSSIKIDKKLENELMESLPECEKRYYGFSWTSKIRASLDYKGGCTFDSFTEGVNEILPVEIEILAVNKKKGRRAEYYQIKAEDENCDEGIINVWKDDYNSFQNEIVVGNFVRLRLNAPSNGFKTYTLSSIGPRSFYKKKQIEKDDDYRLVLLRKPDGKPDELTIEQEKEIEKWQTN